MLLNLSDPAARDVAIAGGKGARLASLIAAGFDVPDGWVVPASVCPRTSDAPIPPELLAALREAIGNDVTTRWAVRSSGAHEDGTTTAFAGQHDTFLCIVGADAVAEHVRKCWMSWWTPRAIAYREANGLADLAPALAVVVQRMAACDVAGVAFTMDPVSGAMDHVVIDANFGLGESVVGGAHAVDHYVLSRAPLGMISSIIADKHAAIVADNAAHGGTREIAVSMSNRYAPALSIAQANAIAALALRVEAHAGWPQDIEWGLVGDRVVLLQARPITTIPPRWTRDESAERFPNAVTPFTWDFVDEGFHKSLRHSLALMGLPAYDGQWFALFDGYVYGNQNAVELYAKRSPLAGRDVASLARELPALLERFRWVRTLPREWNAALPAFLADIESLERVPVESLAPRELWAHIERIAQLGTRYFLPNIAISLGHGLLHRAVGALIEMAVPDDNERDELQATLVRCTTMTARVNAELRELARLASKDPSLVASLEAGALAELYGAHHDERSEFWCAFGEFVVRHGHRETDFDPYCPTWSDAPWVVLAQVRALLDAPVRTDDERSLRAAQKGAERRVLGAVPTPMRGMAAAVMQLAREYTALDDLEHYHTTRLSQPLRRAVRALGAMLVSRGLVDDPMDAFFARREFAGRAASADTDAEWRALAGEIREAKLVWERARRTTPRWTLDDSEDDAPPMPNDSAVLSGVPGSPGAAEGVVHVVNGAEDFATFPRGAVLVARTTNPAWTPLFYAAAAVVTESGGALSHGAVTAREARIPAVMAVPGVMRRLRTGDRVRVDGTRGTITIAE